MGGTTTTTSRCIVVVVVVVVVVVDTIKVPGIAACCTPGQGCPHFYKPKIC